MEKQEIDLRKLFEHAAVNFLGCQGGDPTADIWLCGLEEGGDFNDIDQLIRAMRASIERDITKPFDVWPEIVKYYDGDHGGHYSALVSWISRDKYLAFNHFRVNSSSHVDIERELGKTFKINLLPLANRDSFSFKHGHTLGFNSKSGDYYDWCVNHRFPQLKELVVRFRPRVIICAQLQQNKMYVDAFRLDKGIEHKGECLEGRRMIHYHVEGTHFFVVPALSGGSSGLTSYASIKAFGKKIRSVSDYSC